MRRRLLNLLTALSLLLCVAVCVLWVQSYLGRLGTTLRVPRARLVFLSVDGKISMLVFPPVDRGYMPVADGLWPPSALPEARIRSAASGCWSTLRPIGSLQQLSEFRHSQELPGSTAPAPGGSVCERACALGADTTSAPRRADAPSAERSHRPPLLGSALPVRTFAFACSYFRGTPPARASGSPAGTARRRRVPRRRAWG